MIIVFWIALAGILVAIGVVIASTIKTMRTPRWSNVPTDNLRRREIAVTAAGATYRAFLYTSTDFDDSPAMPGVILLPNRGEKFPAFEHWAACYALQGLPTLAVELVAKDVPDKQLVDVLVDAFPAFKKALVENSKVDGSRIGVVGFGVPALAGVYAGAKDNDVKAICCGGMPRLDMARSEGTRGKIFLSHCKDDEFAPFEEFSSNKEALAIGELEYLLLDMGGHVFLSQEMVVAAFFSIALNKVMKPRYKQFTPTGVAMP
jgi:dienelactone hydrolase